MLPSASECSECFRVLPSASPPRHRTLRGADESSPTPPSLPWPAAPLILNAPPPPASLGLPAHLESSPGITLSHHRSAPSPALAFATRAAWPASILCRPPLLYDAGKSSTATCQEHRPHPHPRPAPPLHLCLTSPALPLAPCLSLSLAHPHHRLFTRPPTHHRLHTLPPNPSQTSPSPPTLASSPPHPSQTSPSPRAPTRRAPRCSPPRRSSASWRWSAPSACSWAAARSSRTSTSASRGVRRCVRRLA